MSGTYKCYVIIDLLYQSFLQDTPKISIIHKIYTSAFGKLSAFYECS